MLFATQRSEKKRFVEEHSLEPNASIVENDGGSFDSHLPPEEVKPLEVEAELPQAAGVAPGAASTSAPTTMTRYSRVLNEEVAAIRIQTVFRGYLVFHYKSNQELHDNIKCVMLINCFLLLLIGKKGVMGFARAC